MEKNNKLQLKTNETIHQKYFFFSLLGILQLWGFAEEIKSFEG